MLVTFGGQDQRPVQTCSHEDPFLVLTSGGWLLPATTKLGQGNIFTSMCLSTWGEGCLPQCMLGYPPTCPPGSRPPQADPPWSRHTPPDQAHPPGSKPPGSRYPPEADTPRTRHTPPKNRHPRTRHPPEQTPQGADTPPDQAPPQKADCSIQLMSGWYASYWNAFLLKHVWWASGRYDSYWKAFLL